MKAGAWAVVPREGKPRGMEWQVLKNDGLDAAFEKLAWVGV